MERIVARYYIETPLQPEAAAAILAGEQSSGTFVAVPGETEELKARFAARVESVEQLETVEHPAIPGGAGFQKGPFHRAAIRVSWSIENCGYNLPVLISTVQGNLYELSAFTGLKLMDLDIPPSFAQHFGGPVFGIEGCRRLTGGIRPAADRDHYKAQHRDDAGTDGGSREDAGGGGDRFYQGRRTAFCGCQFLF